MPAAAAAAAGAAAAARGHLRRMQHRPRQTHRGRRHNRTSSGTTTTATAASGAGCGGGRRALRSCLAGRPDGCSSAASFRLLSCCFLSPLPNPTCHPYGMHGFPVSPHVLHLFPSQSSPLPAPVAFGAAILFDQPPHAMHAHTHARTPDVICPTSAPCDTAFCLRFFSHAPACPPALQCIWLPAQFI